jgi:hypothetical protein
MASLMDSIMKQYYSGAPFSSVGGVVPPSGAPSLSMFSPQPMAPQMPDRTRGVQPIAPQMPQQSPFGAMPQFTPMPQGGDALRQAGENMVMGQQAADAGLPTSNIPMPPSRPRDLPGRTPGFLDQLLSGPDYQSNSMPVNVQAAGPAMQGQQMPDVAINYGDPNSAADFFRADALRMQNSNIPGFLGGY